MLRLFLLFTLVPAIELYLLMQIGGLIGVAETVLLIVLTGIAGSYMAKREGMAVLKQLQEDAQKGIPPADRLVEGLLVLIGGVLLITPGVLTDFFGFSLIAPWTRRALAPALKKAVMGRVATGGSMGGFSASFGAPRHAAPPQKPDAPKPDGHSDKSPFDHPVL
ncbi:MAG: FxsA family protein [Myxococcota bacterium]|nr:FxsA family protein [Myxococcota bacterium]